MPQLLPPHGSGVHPDQVQADAGACAVQAVQAVQAIQTTQACAKHVALPAEVIGLEGPLLGPFGVFKDLQTGQAG